MHEHDPADAGVDLREVTSLTTGSKTSDRRETDRDPEVLVTVPRYTFDSTLDHCDVEVSRGVFTKPLTERPFPGSDPPSPSSGTNREREVSCTVGVSLVGKRKGEPPKVSLTDDTVLGP